MSSQTSTFRDKVQQLEQELAKCNKNVDGTASCLSIMNVVAIATPIVIFLSLYFLAPGFVKIKEGGKMIKSKKRIFLYGSLATSILWALMYGYTKYSAVNVV